MHVRPAAQVSREPGGGPDGAGFAVVSGLKSFCYFAVATDGAPLAAEEAIGADRIARLLGTLGDHRDGALPLLEARGRHPHSGWGRGVKHTFFSGAWEIYERLSRQRRISACRGSQRTPRQCAAARCPPPPAYRIAPASQPLRGTNCRARVRVVSRVEALAELPDGGAAALLGSPTALAEIVAALASHRPAVRDAAANLLHQLMVRIYALACLFFACLCVPFLSFLLTAHPV